MTRARRLRALGVGLAATIAALIVLVTTLGSSAGLAPPALADLLWFVSYLAFPVVGVLLVWHRPSLAIGWVYLAIGVTATVGGTAGALSEHHLAGGRVGRAAWEQLISDLGFGTAWTLASTLALLLFPVAMPRRWRRGLVLVTAVGYAVLVAGHSLSSGPPTTASTDRNPVLASPLAIAGWTPWPELAAEAATYGLLGVTAAALVLVALAWRRAVDQDRARLLWLGLGVVVALLTMVVATVLVPVTPAWVGSLAEALWVAVIPVSVGIGVLRSGLFDIAAVLNRTIVYAVLTGLVLLAYFGSLAAATRLLGADAGRAASLLASALVAVCLAPVKSWLDRVVERWLFGDRAQPYRVLADLAARLERTSALDDLIATVTETVRRALRLPLVEVVLEPSRAAPPPGAVALPLVVHGRSEGVLVVGRRPGQAVFSTAELELLEDLARQVAREVHVARLATDLQDSRERLVRAREAERLRVRRDLHDGIGPTLAAAGLQVDALRERWRSDDPRVGELLNKVRAEIEQSVQGVREVVEGLRPPALDDLGLVGVVREHVHALTQSGLRVDLRCPPTLEVGSAAAEVAAYRIVTEALTNVVRHARATNCEGALRVRSGWLLLDISDDGIGPASAEGVGIASMRERAL